MKNFIVASVLGHKAIKKHPFSDDLPHRKSELDCGLRRSSRRLHPHMSIAIKERRASRSVDRNFKLDSDDGGFSQWRNNRADDAHHAYPVCLSKRVQLVLQSEAPEAVKDPFQFVQMPSDNGPKSLDFHYRPEAPQLSRNLPAYGTLPRSRYHLKYHRKKFWMFKIFLVASLFINNSM